MTEPRTIIRVIDLTPYSGPTTMEELRAQTMKMEVVEENDVHVPVSYRKTYDRAQIDIMIGQGHKLKTIADATGASVSLICRIRKGNR